MRKADHNRVSLKLTRHTYSLTPRRSAAHLPGIVAAICAVSALVAAGFALKNSREQAQKLDAICAPPVSEQELRAQLTHAGYALEQEAATRAVLEARVAERTSEIERLRHDLAFLDKQRRPD